ncbi:hypothetical protein [Pseudonocardia hydrocarbonoxydans]|uniref:Uncharacterized protein n=1 Tax=Pseudonocardia hydrocarbonoxydans TaxID=76726 RepID=A0A4Y3WUM2_9PSEU|nr:hypothetical protein [Pseudonocardia hydrocarbonoxydans]GEC22585.1 hypothetical protein PHY01_48680 [Pseudonocardia hydrocarbonoxydans]
MWFPYGAGRWLGVHDGGADRPDDVPPPVVAGRGAPDPVDGTAVSAWEAVSIVLGLAVLSGSTAGIVVTAFVVVLALLVVTAGDEQSTERPPGAPPQAW